MSASSSIVEHYLRALLEKLHSRQDIVQDWHDPDDFSLWVPIFAAAFAPPEKDAS